MTYASWISMQIKASSFLHILDVYSHTKLNTPVLVWSLQLSNFGLTYVMSLNIFQWLSDYWLCKIPYKEFSPLYLLLGSIEIKFDVMMSEKLKKLVLRSVASHFILVVARMPGKKLMFYHWKVHNTWLFTQLFLQEP